MNLFVISSFFTAAASIFFGSFVFLKNWKGMMNKMWFLTTATIAIWSFSLGMEVSAPNYETAFLWNKILNIGAIFIPIFFYHFIVSFLELNEKEKKFIILGYIFAITFLVLFNLFTPLFVKGVPPNAGFNYWIEIGPIYYSFFAFFVIYMLRTFFLLLKSRKESTDVKRAQIKYILLGSFIGFAGGVTNFFPQIFNINIYPFGHYLVILYIIFISYSSLRHHLFNIKVIATELLTIAIWIFLLVKVALSESLKDLIINTGLLVAVVFLGALLVRSVLKEVRQREKMEEMAKKVQKAYEVEKRASRELKRLGDVKNQFIMASQHHLRTPLTSMRGYIDLVLTGSYGKVPEKIKQALTKFEISIKRLNKVINEFLDITQFQLGKEVVTLRDGVDLRPIFKEIQEELGYEAKARGIKLEFNVPKDIPEIRADLEKIKIGMFNIVDNAIKYTQKGKVCVDLSATNSKVLISVKDTGVGIAREQQKELFNRLFERGQEAMKIHGTGKGIGLFITAHIIKAHKGRIWAESGGRGKGSIFFVELPIK